MKHSVKLLLLTCSLLLLITTVFFSFAAHATDPDPDDRPPADLEHGRPMVESSNGGIYCLKCTGDDCGAACL